MPRPKRHPKRCRLSRALISRILALKGSKLPSLQLLYCVLLHPSYEDKSKGYSTRSKSLAKKSHDIENLVVTLFKEIETRFRKFFCYLSSDDERGDSRSEVSDCVDELAPLLRCCMAILTLVDPDVALEKTQILLGILERLILLVPRGDKFKSVSFEKRISREFLSRDAESTVTEDYVAVLSITEPPHPYSPFLSTLLEVFADEFLMQRHLRELFTHPAPRISLSMCHLPDDPMGNVMELISLQFILLLSDKDGSENFLKRLSCRACSDLRICEINLTSSLSLILNPTILLAPKVLQAHLISLVSETWIESMSEDKKCIIDLLGASYFTAFELSISLYSRFMSTFLTEDHPIRGAPCESQRLMDISNGPFDCYVQGETQATLGDVIARLVSLWNLRSQKPRHDILADSIACSHESSKDENFVRILDHVVHGAFSDSGEDSLSYESNEPSPEDVYLLTALLKLMQVSMSAAIRCLRVRDENSASLGEASLCKWYDHIVNVIGTFRNFSISLPNQKKLFDAIEANNPTKNETTKWMLLHISGLLSFSFASRFDFLVKNCVLLLVEVMSLYVLEGGNLEAFQYELIPSSEIYSCRSTLGKPREVLVSPKTCIKIASRIQEMRSGFTSSKSRSCVSEEDESGSIEEETEETCDGKVFLDCVLESSRGVADYDDLAEFVECKAGKDYSRWLNDKERHRRWKSKKIGVLRWKTRRKTWTCGK